MSVVKATPYLFFNGTAEQALARYRKALDAQVHNILRYDQGPDDIECAPENRNRIMNAVFTVGAAEFMCSDRTEDEPAGTADVVITLHFDDADQEHRKHKACVQVAATSLTLSRTSTIDRFGRPEI